MNQLRYLKKATLLKETLTKQDNGYSLSSTETIGTYSIQIQKVTDSISATIYGADISRMYRVCTPYHTLENCLNEKFNFDDDNISTYFLEIDSKRYEVSSINDNWVDVKL